MKPERKYKLMQNEDKHSFMKRCIEREMNHGREKEISCEFCESYYYRLKGNYNYTGDDKFIYNAF